MADKELLEILEIDAWYDGEVRLLEPAAVLYLLTHYAEAERDTIAAEGGNPKKYRITITVEAQLLDTAPGKLAKAT